MPVTINSPQYWADDYLNQLLNDEYSTKIDPRLGKLIPGQIDPNSVNTIPGGAPMLNKNDPNKAQGDYDWIMELLRYANKAGISWDAQRNMR